MLSIHPNLTHPMVIFDWRETQHGLKKTSVWSTRGHKASSKFWSGLDDKSYLNGRSILRFTARGDWMKNHKWEVNKNSVYREFNHRWWGFRCRQGWKLRSPLSSESRKKKKLRLINYATSDSDYPPEALGHSLKQCWLIRDMILIHFILLMSTPD